MESTFDAESISGQTLKLTSICFSIKSRKLL